jgi:hypothetical protein
MFVLDMDMAMKRIRANSGLPSVNIYLPAGTSERDVAAYSQVRPRQKRRLLRLRSTSRVTSASAISIRPAVGLPICWVIRNGVRPNILGYKFGVVAFTASD